MECECRQEGDTEWGMREEGYKQPKGVYVPAQSHEPYAHIGEEGERMGGV
jgi:hypothetical protein